MTTIIVIETDSFNEAAEILDKIESVQHIGDGYTSQLWDIMGLFGEMFFLGTSYFENTFVDINSTV